MRGTREFADRASYEEFLREIFTARNKKRTSLGDDLRGMGELPPMRIEDFRRERVRVTRFSTIRAAKRSICGCTPSRSRSGTAGRWWPPSSGNGAEVTW